MIRAGLPQRTPQHETQQQTRQKRNRHYQTPRHPQGLSVSVFLPLYLLVCFSLCMCVVLSLSLSGLDSYSAPPCPLLSVSLSLSCQRQRQRARGQGERVYENIGIVLPPFPPSLCVSPCRDLEGVLPVFMYNILSESAFVPGFVTREKDRESEKGGRTGGSTNTNLLSETERSCLLYTSPSPRDVEESRMPSSA